LDLIKSIGVVEMHLPMNEAMFCYSGQALFHYGKLFLRRMLSAFFKDTIGNLRYFGLNCYFRGHGTIKATNTSSLVK
jgi:hypothetical protein